jgi:adenylate cyclase
LAQIRSQILRDLVPAMLIGLVIAILFAQLLIHPIRKLVMALRKVADGDYEVRVDIDRSDEIGELVGAFNGMTEELQKKRELRKYLSDSTYRQIMEAPVGGEGQRLGGSRVKATILFSDIRDFVKHCDEMEAEEVTSMLTEYFSNMVEVVYKHDGEVDKFIGDALLAVFYDDADKSGKSDGIQKGSTALQAIYCALEMRERLAEFNKKRQSLGKPVIEIGIGITHGEIISGPIGAKDRMDFTVIGDVVNLASRIEKISKAGRYSRIVFADEVEEKVRGLLVYEEMGAQAIQGFDNVRVYELQQIRELKDILSNLTAKDADLRARSVELLGYSRNPDAIPHILSAIDDSEEIVRIQSVLALSRLGQADDPKILDKLFKVLDKEKSKRVVSALVTALGMLSRTEEILKIAPFLNHEDERVVANVVESLGKVGSPKCLDLVSARLSSRNNRVKANAAMALFSAGHVEVIDMLKPMLLHSDPLMRSSAAFAIGELTLLAHQDKLLDLWKKRGKDVNYFLGEIQASVPMLVALLRDPEAIVKRQALIALGKIKDRSSVLPIIDMIEVGKDSKELIKEASQALWSIGSHKMIREVLNRLV